MRTSTQRNERPHYTRARTAHAIPAPADLPAPIAARIGCPEPAPGRHILRLGASHELTVTATGVRSIACEPRGEELRVMQASLSAAPNSGGYVPDGEELYLSVDAPWSGAHHFAGASITFEDFDMLVSILVQLRAQAEETGLFPAPIHQVFE